MKRKKNILIRLIFYFISIIKYKDTKDNDENMVNDDYDIDKINNNNEEINSNGLNDNITITNNNLNNIINQ